MKLTVIKPQAILRTSVEGMLEHLEHCGRTCYKSEGRIVPGSADKFIRRIIKMGHESVLEHASVTATITGDRSMSHQLVRHRLASYSQCSQRYCDLGKLGFQVVCPPSIGVPVGTYYFSNDKISPFEDPLCVEKMMTTKDYTERQLLWLINRMDEYKEYLEMREEGILPEDARSCLPNATKTEVAMTCNIRQWRHIFLDRALNPRAQWQIRDIMKGLLDELNGLVPALFGDLYE